MEKLKLVIIVAFLSFLINESNAQILYLIDSITTNPQYTTQENIQIRVDGKIYSNTYGIGDTSINTVGDTVFIFIEFKDGFGNPNDNWTLIHNLQPMQAGDYVVKCEVQILVPLHSLRTKVDSFQVVELTGVNAEMPDNEPSFLRNHPNPATNNTRIEFKVYVGSFYDIVIHDSNGRQVKSIRNIWYEKGDVSIPIETKNMSNGVYFYTVQSSQVYQTRRMIIQKQ